MCTIGLIINLSLPLPSQDERTLHPLTLGCIASYYYLHHGTVRLFKDRLHPNSTHRDLLQLLCVRTN